MAVESDSVLNIPVFSALNIPEEKYTFFYQPLQLLQLEFQLGLTQQCFRGRRKGAQMGAVTRPFPVPKWNYAHKERKRATEYWGARWRVVMWQRSREQRVRVGEWVAGRPCCKNVGTNLWVNGRLEKKTTHMSSQRVKNAAEAVSGHGLIQLLAAASSWKCLSVFLKDCPSKNSARCCLTECCIRSSSQEIWQCGGSSGSILL